MARVEKKIIYMLNEKNERSQRNKNGKIVTKEQQRENNGDLHGNPRVYYFATSFD